MAFLSSTVSVGDSTKQDRKSKRRAKHLDMHKHKPDRHIHHPHLAKHPHEIRRPNAPARSGHDNESAPDSAAANRHRPANKSQTKGPHQ